MKTLAYLLVAGLTIFGGSVFAQQTDQTDHSDSTGLPGDNFSLQGALEMFKNADSPEDFEKRLNTENNYVNNLDLNGDGDIDYIKVVDNMENEVHAIVMQVQVSETEIQDIAVIEIEKNGNESAILQIVGDEELYGDSAIIEPVEVADNGSKSGPSMRVHSVKLVVVNVWFWPSVKYIYGPAYKPYVSPWKWRHYPNWWKPWKPYGWGVFYRHHKPYHVYYQPVYVHRVVIADHFYRPHRHSSVIVVNRYQPAHQHYREVHHGPYYRQPVQQNHQQQHQQKQQQQKVQGKQQKQQEHKQQQKKVQGKQGHR